MNSPVVGSMDHGLVSDVVVKSLSPTLVVLACKKIMGVSETLVIVDVQDPAQPKKLGAMDHGLISDITMTTIGTKIVLA